MIKLINGDNNHHLTTFLDVISVSIYYFTRDPEFKRLNILGLNSDDVSYINKLINEKNSVNWEEI